MAALAIAAEIEPSELTAFWRHIRDHPRPTSATAGVPASRLRSRPGSTSRTPIPSSRGFPSTSGRRRVRGRLRTTQGSGHGGSHPHLAHEFVRSIVEGRKPKVDEVTAANWTSVGIAAHQSAMSGGEHVYLPAFAWSAH
jgi:hypothetical protein